MVEDPPSLTQTNTTNTQKDFQFATKEGLIIVSLILFTVYAFWYKIFEFYYQDEFFKWIFIFTAYSFVVFITMSVLLVTGIYVFWKDRKYIITHEKLGAFIFIIGALILLSIPLGWAFNIIEYQGAFAPNSNIFIIIGVLLTILGSIILARTGGFFLVWMIGVSIYLIMSFHESFKFIIWTGFFGPYDNFVGSIGIYVVATSFILFMYHDIKFFYLSRIVKKGNQYRREKNYPQALRCFKKTLKIYPLFTTALNNMGNVYFNQGKPKEAIKCYKKALIINPGYINARRNLEVVSKKFGKI
jgi:tetratricopeptide (TPR) repeat protein